MENLDIQRRLIGLYMADPLRERKKGKRDVIKFNYQKLSKLKGSYNQNLKTLVSQGKN